MLCRSRPGLPPLGAAALNAPSGGPWGPRGPGPAGGRTCQGLCIFGVPGCPEQGLHPQRASRAPGPGEDVTTRAHTSLTRWPSCRALSWPADPRGVSESRPEAGRAACAVSARGLRRACAGWGCGPRGLCGRGGGWGCWPFSAHTSARLGSGVCCVTRERPSPFGTRLPYLRSGAKSSCPLGCRAGERGGRGEGPGKPPQLQACCFPRVPIGRVRLRMHRGSRGIIGSW